MGIRKIYKSQWLGLASWGISN